MNNLLRCFLVLATASLFGACASPQEMRSASASADSSLSLSEGYMPPWTAQRFYEAEMCANEVLPPGGTYHDAVIAARHHDRHALEQIIECSYSPRCDAAAGELHSGVLEQLLLAWGDIDFSRALSEVKSRHGGRYPAHAFLILERDMRRFFPLTTAVLYK